MQARPEFGPRIPQRKDRTDSHKLFSDLHMYALMHIITVIINKMKFLKF